MKKTRERNFTTDNLAQKLIESWKTKGPFRNTTKPEIYQSGDKVFTELLDIPHILWFEELRSGTEKPGSIQLKRYFYDYVLSTGSQNIQKIQEFVTLSNKNVPSDKKSVYPIYGNCEFNFESRVYKGYGKDEEQRGVLIKAEINHLPLGRKDHLSDNLFEYVFNGIVLPATRAVTRDSLPVSSWYRFS